MTDPVVLADAVKEYRARFGTRSCAENNGSFAGQTRASVGGVLPLKKSVDVSKPLAERLFDLFGGGDRPDLRRALYLRVQLTCQTFGRPCEDVLAGVVDYALGARVPGNCFAYTVLRRFREAGFVKGGV